MLDKLGRIFEHNHNYKQAETVLRASSVNPTSGVVGTANVFRCKCGDEYYTVTPAGEQQIAWGDKPRAVMGMA